MSSLKDSSETAAGRRCGCWLEHVESSIWHILELSTVRYREVNVHDRKSRQVFVIERDVPYLPRANGDSIGYGTYRYSPITEQHPSFPLHAAVHIHSLKCSRQLTQHFVWSIIHLSRAEEIKSTSKWKTLISSTSQTFCHAELIERFNRSSTRARGSCDFPDVLNFLR